MATRCTIAAKIGGEFKAIYCRNDGYKEYTGALLKKYYNSEERICKLLDLGFISLLGRHVGNPPYGHSFENPVEGYTIAYKRDRAEHYADAVTSKSYKGVLDYLRQPINYVWKNGIWYYCSYAKASIEKL